MKRALFAARTGTRYTGAYQAPTDAAVRVVRALPSDAFRSLFGKNATLTGGPAPVRNYIEDVLRDVLSRTIDPGRVLDAEVGLDDAAGAYRLMNSRERLEVMLLP